MGLNTKPIIKVLSAAMVLVGVAMLLPGIVSLIYKEPNSALCFFACGGVMIVVGLTTIFISPAADNTVLRMKDGFFIVGVAWLLISALGALPFVFSGSIPNFIDAFFETASGFTTTGSTILTDIEALPKGMLFWRSFTHWLGGMGVLVLTIAILPMLGVGGAKIMRAETTGPTMDKITFTITGSAKRLYLIYTGFTFFEVVLLCAGGMNLYDSLVHSFGTLGTGGFSSYGASIAYFDSTYVDMVISIFMIIAGANFSLYYYLFAGSPKLMFKDTEFRTYIGIVTGSTVFIMVMLLIKNFYGSIAEAFRYALFQVASIITTTGYATADFDQWPLPCRMVLLILMICGACAGSTAGGLKVIRIIMLCKMFVRRMVKKLHPHRVSPVRVGGSVIEENTLSVVSTLAQLYIGLVLASTIFISLIDSEGLVTSFTAVIACISNIGPGFDKVGPVMNFAFFSAPTKILLSLLMIGGRLELYTIVLLFTPSFWGKKA